MKIIKITMEYENGTRYEINEPDVTNFLEAGKNNDLQMYLLLSFCPNLAGGLNWEKIEE